MSAHIMSRTVIELIAKGTINTISVNIENSGVESTLLTKDSEKM